MDILMICKNNENYFKFIFPILIKKLDIIEPKFYIYENNSTDNTKSILHQLSNKYQIYIKTENIIESNNRYKNICIARNKLLEFYRENNNDNNKWVILLDTNIIFNKDTILNLIKNSMKGKMILSNTNYYNSDKELNDKYYYDLLALNYGKYFKKKQISFNNNYKENIIKLESGFGGLVLIDRNYIINNNWHLKKPKEVDNHNCKNIICEHWDFCYKMNLHDDNIYLVKDSRSLWYMDEYINNNNKKKYFYNYINKNFK